MKIRSARIQNGQLISRCGSWLGRYRHYPATGKPEVKTLKIGRVESMDESEARIRLREIIERDTARRPLVNRIGLSAIVAMPAKETPSGPGPLSQGKGTFAELVVCADLIRKGVHVFRAIDPQAPCDLVAMQNDGKFLRVEVKHVTVDAKGLIPCNLHRNLGKFDLLAFVFADGRIVYRTPEQVIDVRYPLGRKPETQVILESSCALENS